MRRPPPAHTAPLPPVRRLTGGTGLLAGVPYAAIPGIRPLELDLYLPGDGDSHAGRGGDAGRDAADVAGVPVVVFLHGGGWRLGSRHFAGPAFAGSAAFERVAAAGIAVASIDYRLSGEAVWPAQLHDAKAAVRWLRARAGELGIDPDRIGVWGESAGGHLAELVALVREPGSEGDVGVTESESDVGVTGASSAVRAVVAWYAPSDLRAVATDLGTDPDDHTTREALLLGGPVPSLPDAAAHASPLTHVTATAPPALLLHGLADSLIPCVQSERLADALRAAGAEVDLHTYPGADHMWDGAPAAADDALERTVAFLRHHLIERPT